MNYTNLKLWVPYAANIIFPVSNKTGKNICLYFYGENVDFFDAYNFMNIKRSFFRNYYMPTIVKPTKVMITPDIRKQILSYKLMPKWGMLGNYSLLQGANFFYDANRYFDRINEYYRITKFNSGRAVKLYTDFINALDGVSSEQFEKTILYCVDLNKPLPSNIFYRKIFPLFNMVSQFINGKISVLPFDKILMFVMTDKGGRYIKLFDIKDGSKNNIARFRSIIINIKSIDETKQSDADIEVIAKLSNEDNTDSNKETIEHSIKNYLKAGGEEVKNIIGSILKNPTPANTKFLTKASMLYNTVGDYTKSNNLISNLYKNSSDSITKLNFEDISNEIIPKEKIASISDDNIIRISKPEELTDYNNPAHLINKRKKDFSENLKNDVRDAFNVLSNKQFPLTVKNIEVNTRISPPSEIHKSIIDKYGVELEDTKGKIHKIEIAIPHLTDDGTFITNGIQKILINQIVRFPIFFRKVDEVIFESAYASMRIISKSLQKNSYFILFMGGEKIPLVMFLSMKYNFDDVMKQYGVTYKIE